MADQEALRQLIERWRELVLRYEQACREANRDGNVELDAYRDGKAMGVKDCMYELEAVLASPGSENGDISDERVHIEPRKVMVIPPTVIPKRATPRPFRDESASPGSVSDQGMPLGPRTVPNGNLCPCHWPDCGCKQ